MKVGVLALQGAVREHIWALSRCGAEAVPVRAENEIEQVDALVLPGGESTTVGKHLVRLGLDTYLHRRIDQGMPVFGTCTGMILLAKEIIGSDQPRIGVMDISVRRNSFGRQIDSCETEVVIPALSPSVIGMQPQDICTPSQASGTAENRPFPAIFIRAPHIIGVGPAVEVLAEFEGRIVLARQQRCLAAAFHPEITNDDRLHRYFLETVCVAR